jgi:diguanylate cyclase (GGDEF)-like protein
MRDGYEANETRILLLDISSRKMIEDRYRELAHFDSLTHIPNRNLFYELLLQAMELSRRNGRKLGLLYFDLDGFKTVNDRYGHSFGDAVLTCVAGRLTTAIRRSDSVARIGGDEFAVIVTNADDYRDTEEAARKILTAVSRPIDHLGRRVLLTTSIGIAQWPVDAENLDALINKADAAMYRAKRGGKNRFASCSDRSPPTSRDGNPPDSGS